MQKEAVPKHWNLLTLHSVTTRKVVFSSLLSSQRQKRRYRIKRYWN